MDASDGGLRCFSRAGHGVLTAITSSRWKRDWPWGLPRSSRTRPPRASRLRHILGCVYFRSHTCARSGCRVNVVLPTLQAWPTSCCRPLSRAQHWRSRYLVRITASTTSCATCAR